MPIRFDKWNSAYDPRAAQLDSLFGQPPSPDEIVTNVANSFATDLARILGTGGGRGPDEGRPAPLLPGDIIG